MSDDIDIPLPEKDAPIEWLRISTGVVFYPPIKLARKIGLEFSRELAEILEPNMVRFDEGKWKITGGGVCEGIEVTIGKQEMEVVVMPEEQAIERYEHKVASIFREFANKFEPQISLESSINAIGLVKLPDGVDSRAFLGGYVMLMNPKRFGTIERPLEILGLRLYFPPYENANWGINTRIESWSRDPQKVYLNADATWSDPKKWDDGFVDQLSDCVTTISKFISEKLIQFLREPPFSDSDKEPDDD